MRVSIPALAALALLGVSPAGAQFRLDNSPSGQRAAFAAATAGPIKPDFNRNRLNPLSPLGGAQGTPGAPRSPYAAATPMQSAQSYSAAPETPRAGIGASAALATAPLAEDPNKPRQALRPQTLTRATSPKP